jgi:hypothetical protein
VAYRASQLNQIYNQSVYDEQIDHKGKAELEKKLDNIKKKVQAQWQLAEEYRAKKKEIAMINTQLEKDILLAKNNLELAEKLSGEAEQILKMEQERQYSLLHCRGLTSLVNDSPELNTKEAAIPDLIRTPSEFSNSTGLMSPSSPAINLNPGKFYLSSIENKITPQVPLSPVQSKAISKYGFDITAFETPSKPIDDGMSDRDELASLFGTPVSPTKKTATFDDIFM